MQQWQQIEFYISPKDYSKVESFLFDNLACSVTKKDLEDKSFVTVLYEDDFDLEYILEELKKSFPIIEQKVECKVIKDQEWTAAWLDDYEPIEIGKNIVIYPSWRELPIDTAKTYIAVDPSVAFGCGNHETTKMCLEWLEENINPNSSLLDYGCGTGILAIAGVKLGGKYAEGIDIDPKSIESSIKNAEMNKVYNKTHFNDVAADKSFDLLIANIFSNVLIALADTMLSKLKDGGKLALSGILANQVDDVQKAFEAKGVKFNKPQNMGGEWFLLSGVKSGL